jgi:hypothetical protein
MPTFKRWSKEKEEKSTNGPVVGGKSTTGVMNNRRPDVPEEWIISKTR